MNRGAKKALAVALAGLALNDDLKRGPPGRGPTAAEIEAALKDHFKREPIKVPRDGRDVTDADVKRAVNAYLKANPIPKPKDGRSVTREEVAAAVSAYIRDNPIPKPKDGRNVSVADVTAVVAEWFRKNPIKDPPGFDDAKVEQDSNTTSYTIYLHHTEKGWIKAGTFRVPRPSILANRRVVFGAVGGGENVATYDDYEQADTRPVQSGADDVKTFNFDAEVQLVKVHPLANDGTTPANETRRCWAAGDGDLTPAIGVGDPCAVGSSEHLFGNRSLLKVFVPAGVDCFVTGYRRKAV